MELPWNYIIWTTLILSPPLFLLLLRGSRKSNFRRPPGPPGWPVVGHIFKLGSMPHRTLASFADQYGPVVSLKLGSVNTVAILSAKAATEFFKKHEPSFMERCPIETMRSHNYHEGSLFLAPPNTYWRVLKRICTHEIFASKRINETSYIRQKCLNDMLLWFDSETKERKNAQKGIEVAVYVFLGLFNMIGNLVFSCNLVDPKSKTGSEFFDAMMGIMELSGTPNVSDFFEGIKWLDLQGLKKRMDKDMGKVLEICSGFVKDRLVERENSGERRNDFLDVLLDFEGNGKDEPDKLLEKEIIIVIAEMFFAGTETTSTTIEWVLSELLRNPDMMTKVKAELNKVVGPNKKFSEDDIDNMPYLQAVVKETFRLHPPAPFLVPRKSAQDTELMGYHIPKNMQVLVSVWAIGRDKESWDDPCEFKPERFLGSKVDYKGQHFELIPFGAGRRMCLGLPLANRMLPLVLGSLLHEFDWELESNVTPGTMDMKEKLGITARKLEPLRVIPKKSRV